MRSFNLCLNLSSSVSLTSTNSDRKLKRASQPVRLSESPEGRVLLTTPTCVATAEPPALDKVQLFQSVSFLSQRNLKHQSCFCTAVYLHGVAVCASRKRENTEFTFSVTRRTRLWDLNILLCLQNLSRKIRLTDFQVMKSKQKELSTFATPVNVDPVHAWRPTTWNHWVSSEQLSVLPEETWTKVRSYCCEQFCSKTDPVKTIPLKTDRFKSGWWYYGGYNYHNHHQHHLTSDTSPNRLMRLVIYQFIIIILSPYPY